MLFKRISSVIVLAIFYLSSCTSPPNPRVYTLPDPSVAEADENDRLQRFQEGKLSFGPLPGTFGPDVFLQKAFVEKADYSVKLALSSDIFKIPKKKFSDDFVLAEELFRLDDEALAAYSKGKKNEERKQAASGIAALGGALVLFASASALLDNSFAFLGELMAPERNNAPSETNLKVYAGMGIGGVMLGIGGLIFRRRYERARSASYTEAADLYNVYLRSLYLLD